jgi:hypothetical protein
LGEKGIAAEVAIFPRVRVKFLRVTAPIGGGGVLGFQCRDAKEYHKLAGKAAAQADEDEASAKKAAALEEKAEAHLKKPHK